MAKGELAGLEEEEQNLSQELEFALLAEDPNDKKNVIIEIRPAAGGEDACRRLVDPFRSRPKP